jgi:hypothetical protein
MSSEEHNSEVNAIFQKRVQDLMLDLAESEARVHNMRFIDNSFKRRFLIRIESMVRRNRFLFRIAKRIRG